jgi:pyrimidine-specific ribonucleoside hydrolase
LTEVFKQKKEGLTVMKYIQKLFIFLLFLVSGNILLAHSGKPAHHVVIDTDGALDDMRAISMLLSGNEIRVLAITCSQGTLEPDLVRTKVKSLLSAYHHEGIPVAAGAKSNRELPYWSGFAGSVAWGFENASGQPAGPEIVTRENDPALLLQKLLGDYSEDITLIALGSLKNYADWLGLYPEMKQKIKRIIWYNNHDIEAGFNYNLSPGSFHALVESGVPVEIVSNNKNALYCDQDYLDQIGRSGSVYAQQIHTVFSDTAVAERIQDKPLWDDLAVLYMTVPVLFSAEERDEVKYITLNRQVPANLIYETIRTLLSSSLATNNRVFKRFPVDQSLYKNEYAGMLDSTMTNYGPEEWKAICLTNEIHGHTGIYSIIGAKMGIRAMEFFHVGINNLRVTSFSGNRPPLSCLTDGVQISTGATPGQGLLTIAGDVEELPTVHFGFNGRTLKMVLNKSIADQMRQEIRYGVENFGLESDTYWLYIERLAIAYWTGFNRHEIFTITEL